MSREARHDLNGACAVCIGKLHSQRLTCMYIQYPNWLCHTLNPICGSYTSDWRHVFCHNPSLEGEVNRTRSQTRQTSGFLSSGCSEADCGRDVLCWVQNKLLPTLVCLLSLSPLLRSLSVSSLGGRSQVSSRQEQQPFMSSDVVTRRTRRSTML